MLQKVKLLQTNLIKSQIYKFGNLIKVDENIEEPESDPQKQKFQFN
jgi:hypothetical protein